MMTATIIHLARWQLAAICLLITGSLLFHSEACLVAAADKADADADKQLQADVDRLIELQKAAKDTATYDKETAAEHIDAWRKAAERGSPIGQFLLGRALDIGAAIAKDEKAAVEWYRKSAEQGYAPAQRNLGNCYLDGRAL
jgi:TPR repeat protein